MLLSKCDIRKAVDSIDQKNQGSRFISRAEYSELMTILVLKPLKYYRFLFSTYSLEKHKGLFMKISQLNISSAVTVCKFTAQQIADYCWRVHG